MDADAEAPFASSADAAADADAEPWRMAPETRPAVEDAWPASEPAIGVALEADAVDAPEADREPAMGTWPLALADAEAEPDACAPRGADRDADADAAADAEADPARPF